MMARLVIINLKNIFYLLTFKLLRTFVITPPNFLPIAFSVFSLKSNFLSLTKLYPLDNLLVIQNEWVLKHFAAFVFLPSVATSKKHY